MIEVDQQTLCNYCRRFHMHERSCNCNESMCVSAKNSYLKSVGITETTDPQKAKTFRNVSTADKLYLVKENHIIPKIKIYNIISVSKFTDGSLSIDSDTGRINISPEHMDKSKTLIYFLLKSDCKKRLDDICMARIATLQKIIDTK